MNHPNREEWISYLYNEVESADKIRLDTHLHECAPCQEQVARWRSAAGALDAWTLPGAAPRITLLPWLRWGAAAGFLLAAGIAIGAVVSRPDTTALRKDLEIQRALVQELSQTVANNRIHDKQALISTLRELETRRSAEMQTLRGDLETVAALTEESLNRAQSQLVRLASYTAPR